MLNSASSSSAEMSPQAPGGQASGARRPHVLFLIDHLMARGGGEGNLLKLVELLPAERVRCSVATFRIHPEIQKTITAPVHVFPWKRVYHWSAWKAALALRRLIRAEQVDIVQTYFETSNLWGGIVAKLSGAALLSSRRDMGILREKKHEFAYKFVNGIADRVLAVSEEVKRFCIEQEGISPEKISVVYNGVDLRRPAPDGANPFAGEEWAHAPRIISCVANLRRIKGIDVLLRAAQRVCREFPDAVFVLAGSMYDREYTAQIQQMVRSMGLERNLRLIGFIEDPVPLLKMSHAFCLLSRSEGFSNALLEAMAYGVPAVVTRVGGNPEAIQDGVNGFLVPSEDDQAAAERLLSLLRDRARAQQIGEAGRNTVRARFSAEAMIHQLLEIYDGLMTRRKRR